MWDPKKIRQARERAGFETQAEAAVRLKIAKNYLCEVETGRRPAGAKLIERMAKLYEVQVQNLLR